MKLTREGAARLGRHESRGFPVGDFEFKQEDFDGLFHFGNNHVVLTLEEANHINNVINQLFLSINKANIHLTQEQANALIEFQYQVEGCE